MTRPRTFLLNTAALVAAVLLSARPAPAQVPRGVSRGFAAVIARADTSVVAWVVARRGTDLDALASRIAAGGGRVRFISRFALAVSAEVRADRLRDFARMPGVTRVQPVGTYFRRERGTGNGEPESAMRSPFPVPRSPVPGDSLYGPSKWPYLQLDALALHSRGLRGAGVRIALLDTGFNTLHPLMSGTTIIAQKDFVYNDSIVRDQPGEAQGEMAHGTGVWSLIAARNPGVLFGMAPDAEFLLAKTEYTLTETRVEEDRWVAAVEWAVGLGAHIISSSLGYLSFDNGFSYSPNELDGDVAITSIAADSASARGVLVVVAAGNAGPGPRTVDTPGDADSAVAVGATDSLGRIASFSSRGPTADGRIKPDVSAPGSLITMAATSTGTTRASGTSFAAPFIAGLAALVQGTRTGPAQDLRLGLLQASDRFIAPDNIFGYGVPDALKLYAFPSGLRTVDPDTGLLQTVTPRFVWDAGTPPAEAGPNQYFLRVGSDSSLHTLVIDTAVATTAFTIRRGLVPGTRLYWRVVASSGLGVAESTAVHGPAIVPPWVTLVSLALPQGATIRDSLPLLTWTSPGAAKPPGPFTYDVYVYPASRTPAQAVVAARGVADQFYQVTSPLERNLPFRWRVVAHLGTDSQVVTSPGTFLVADNSTPLTTVLFQNFPNPFPNAGVGLTSTCIWFDVAQPGAVQLEILDVRGRLVRRLAPSATVPSVLPAGRYGRPAGDAAGTCDDRFAWDGRDETGGIVRPGVYVYRLTTPGFRDLKRIVFLGAP